MGCLVVLHHNLEIRKTIACVAFEVENIYVNPCLWLGLDKVSNSSPSLSPFSRVSIGE